MCVLLQFILVVARTSNTSMFSRTSRTYLTFLASVACHFRFDIVIFGPTACHFLSDFLIFAPIFHNFCLDLLILRQDIVIVAETLYFFVSSLFYHRACEVYAGSS